LGAVFFAIHKTITLPAFAALFVFRGSANNGHAPLRNVPCESTIQTLEKPQGTVVRSIPLSQALQTNMPMHTVIGNEYRGDGQEYKIVTAAERTKKNTTTTPVYSIRKSSITRWCSSTR
jgi:hypothetical protein